MGDFKAVLGAIRHSLSHTAPGVRLSPRLLSGLNIRKPSFHSQHYMGSPTPASTSTSDVEHRPGIPKNQKSESLTGGHTLVFPLFLFFWWSLVWGLEAGVSLGKASPVPTRLVGGCLEVLDGRRPNDKGGRLGRFFLELQSWA